MQALRTITTHPPSHKFAKSPSARIRHGFKLWNGDKATLPSELHSEQANARAPAAGVQCRLPTMGGEVQEHECVLAFTLEQVHCWIAISPPSLLLS